MVLWTHPCSSELLKWCVWGWFAIFLQCHCRAGNETDPSLHSLRAPSILVLPASGQESQTPGSDLESEWKKKGRNLNRQETRAGISQEEQEAELRTEKDMEVTGKERQHPLITMYRIFNGLVPAPKQISLTIKHAPLCCRHYSSWFSYFSQVFSLCRNHREQEGNQDVVIEAYIVQKKCIYINSESSQLVQHELPMNGFNPYLINSTFNY